MTLDEMCIAAARYSDRYDEFEKNDGGGYEDDALHYFNVFKDAINEAHRSVSRQMAKPDTYTKVKVDKNKQIDLSSVSPAVFCVKNLLDETRSAPVNYTFDTKYVLNVEAEPGSAATLYYHYVPDDLVRLNDSPIFTEAQVDPMVYISLAVARIWQSEKKFEYANHWMSQYYTLLREIRGSLDKASNRRIPRRRFR